MSREGVNIEPEDRRPPVTGLKLSPVVLVNGHWSRPHGNPAGMADTEGPQKEQASVACADAVVSDQR